MKVKALYKSVFLCFILLFSVNTYAEVESLKEKLETITITGIEVSEIIKSEGEVTIKGTAKDNQSISSYMRRLDEEVGSPELEYIKREKDAKGSIGIFSINIKRLN